MNLIIFASTLLLALAIAIAVKKSDNKTERDKEEFFEREHKANFVRKKSLDKLDYVSIPDRFFEYDYKKAIKNSPVAETIEKNLEILNSLKDAKIVNFTGKTNTDLKLEYGTANINILSEYDQNFTSLVQAIHSMAECFIETDKEYTKELLTYAIEVNSDMSISYKMLVDIYVEDCDDNELSTKKEWLISKAKNLNSVMSPSIIRYVENAGVESEDTVTS